VKKIYAQEKYCIGCRLCEVYCSAVHSEYPNDLVKAFNRSKIVPTPRVKVEEDRPLSFAMQCRHCDEPHCLKACITGAMYRDEESGAILNDAERCVGCWTCIVACPYGGIFRDESKSKVVAKCDYCLDQGDPACVKNCPNGALKIEEGGE